MGEPTWQDITAEAIRRKAQALEDGRGYIELEALIVEITREGWKPPEVTDADDGIKRRPAALLDRDERIKELEAAVKGVAQCEIPGENNRLPDDHGCRYFFTFGEIRAARALLKAGLK